MHALQGMILTPIVDKEDVEVWIVFFKQCLHRTCCIHLFVVSRHNDGNLWGIVFREGRIMALALLALLHDHEVIHEGETHESEHNEDDEQSREEVGDMIDEFSQREVELHRIVSLTFWHRRHQLSTAHAEVLLE